VEYRPLGSTGLQVSELALGTMMYGTMGNPDRGDCVRQIRSALEAGINLVDTADVYSAGESEEFVGEAVAGCRDEVIIATKFGMPGGADRNAAGGTRHWVMRAVERSLRRLGTDYIDLYQMHRPDPRCDIEETLGALDDLRRAGKIRYIGCSTFPAELIVEAHAAADRRGYVRFRTEQPPYSIFAREAETSVFPTCRRHGMGVLCWAPLAAGWLAGRYRKGEAISPDSRLGRQGAAEGLAGAEYQARLDLVEELATLSREAGLSLTQLALGFVLEHPAVTSAIIGPRSQQQLDNLLDRPIPALDTVLLDRLDRLVAPGTNTVGERSAFSRPGLSGRQRRRRPSG